VRGVDRGLQCRPAGSAQALEAGELRLDRHRGGAYRIDGGAAVALDGRGGEFGRAAGEVSCGLDRDWPQRSRVGVETKHDLAAPLLDESCEPVSEGDDASGGLAEGA
jgi:hypothetical protein